MKGSGRNNFVLTTLTKKKNSSLYSGVVTIFFFKEIRAGNENSLGTTDLEQGSSNFGCLLFFVPPKEESVIKQ
jgi:hypothetical protein